MSPIRPLPDSTNCLQSVTSPHSQTPLPSAQSQVILSLASSLIQIPPTISPTTKQYHHHLRSPVQEPRMENLSLGSHLHVCVWRKFVLTLTTVYTIMSCILNFFELWLVVNTSKLWPDLSGWCLNICFLFLLIFYRYFNFFQLRFFLLLLQLITFLKEIKDQSIGPAHLYETD